MAKKNGKSSSGKKPLASVPKDTFRAIVAVLLIIVGAVLTLAGFGAAGPAGSDAYILFGNLLGVGYFLLPILFFMLGGAALREERPSVGPLKLVSSVLFLVTGLGFIQIVSGKGGFFGRAIADPAVKYFDIYAAVIGLGGLLLISLLLLLEGRISMQPFAGAWALVSSLWRKKEAGGEPVVTGFTGEEDEDEEDAGAAQRPEPAQAGEPVPPRPAMAAAAAKVDTAAQQAKAAALSLKSLLGTYTPPPLSLLERDKGRPGVGDIKGNANIIKRTLANFGVQIELDEISIGPSVTRYAIKPAEGVRLSKIVALQQNLALALAAKGGIRIEAPIPGKALVGIEVPNSAKVTVGLGTLLEASEFQDSHKPLMVALGRDIAGGSLFSNVAKMPHALIAGATGSGKSVAIHTIITSLLYRCGPSQLRFIFIDPKRVELTLYRSLPHLLTPVITDAKKAIMALRWAGKEMERRYNLLEEHRVRDIESYHTTVLAPQLEKIKKQGATEGEPVPEAMPYIVIVIDELADIMQSYPRELEAGIVRLAQMSRAVGIHLILSTQRPSVNVITGLIKANVPARIALQVASQIDSRTILDQGGAESLLGAGDMLYLSADMNKPVRLQNAFVSEAEVKKIVDFIADNNEAEVPVEIAPAQQGSDGVGLGSSAGGSSGGFGDDEDVDDDMVEQARRVVVESGKASTSFLQRRLSIGYARAARIMDALEAKGVIGPANGAKPRDILDKGAGPAPAAAPSPEEAL